MNMMKDRKEEDCEDESEERSPLRAASASSKDLSSCQLKKDQDFKGVCPSPK